MAMTMADWKALPQWACWTSIDGRKVPMNPATGRAAKSNDPATWTTAAEAWTAKKRRGWGGLNFALTLEAGIVGVDLDDCFEERSGIRRLKDYARQIVQMLNTYTEFSPSGNGLHLFALGKIPHNIKRDADGFEMYAERHFLTVTGRQFGAAAVEEGFVSGNIEARQDELLALFVTFGGDIEPEPRPIVRRELPQGATEADIAAALRYIPPKGSYHDWVTVLMAIHNALPDERGVTLAESWSPGYRGEVAAKFRSFDEAGADGITVGTLFHMAKGYGYRQERPIAAAARSNGRGKADITDALAQRRVGYAR